MRMVADHMEAGFLENIIDMVRHDKSLFGMIPFLLKDERQRVRIGGIAIIEALYGECKKEIEEQVPLIGKILKDAADTVIKGDAIYALSIIGGEKVLAHLKEALNDPDAIIRKEAREALEELG